MKGEPIKVEQEILWGYHLIHMERPATEERKYDGDYVVSLTREGDLPFSSDLATRLYGRDQEVVFLKIPESSDSQYSIKVVSRAQYPWREVFSGSVASIPAIAK